MLKTTPISLFSAEISPLCASIIFLQMANPNPVPFCFSKTFISDLSSRLAKLEIISGLGSKKEKILPKW